MPLSKRKRGEKTVLPEGVLSRLQLSPYKIRQAGLATEEIGYRTLVREIRAVGSIEYDERRWADLSARVAGRADELFVNFEGARVQKGDPLYTLYSPDLVTAQEEYLLALKAMDEIRLRSPGENEAHERAQRLAASTRERLQLWGISAAQIEELQSTRKARTHLVIHAPSAGVVVHKKIHAGHYLSVGEDPYEIADDSTVWMVAEVFERDLGLVKTGQTVEIAAEAYAGEKFIGAVAFIQPTVAPETRTVKVRVDVPNSAGKLKPGMYVTAFLHIPLGRRGPVRYVC